METVQKYGLKKWHLSKFQKQVERFYRKVIVDRNYKSNLVIKYRKRFVKHRDNLFTFLEHDGIPWHNNTAENTIRYLALQRNISGSFHESGARNYLYQKQAENETFGQVSPRWQRRGKATRLKL